MKVDRMHLKSDSSAEMFVLRSMGDDLPKEGRKAQVGIKWL